MREVALECPEVYVKYHRGQREPSTEGRWRGIHPRARKAARPTSGQLHVSSSSLRCHQRPNGIAHSQNSVRHSSAHANAGRLIHSSARSRHARPIVPHDEGVRCAWQGHLRVRVRPVHSARSEQQSRFGESRFGETVRATSALGGALDLPPASTCRHTSGGDSPVHSARSEQQSTLQVR